MKNAYKDLENYINDFSEKHNTNLNIDTLRLKFSKQYKLKKLKSLGEWVKLDKKNKQIQNKLLNRLKKDNITSIYQLKGHNIYYFNSNEDKPKYRQATLIIFGMKQYNKKSVSKALIETIVNILTNRTSKNKIDLDVCHDTKQKPKINNLNVFFDVIQYKNNDNVKTDTHYINNTENTDIKKVCIYDKALKNNLDYKLYRLEFTITLQNIKDIYLSLDELLKIIHLAKG